MTVAAIVGDVTLQRYKDLDAKVDRSESDGVEARWEFGRALLRERIGKKLPKGRLAEVAAAIGKSEQEIGYRLLFASRYPDRGSFTNAVGKYRSWHGIVEHFSRKAEAHVSQNTGESEWYTPAEYIAAARDTMGEIDLDPASSPEANAVVGAARFYTASQNGLSKPWLGRVWLNPPYASDKIGLFAEKLVEEYTADRTTQAVVLVNNATETQWFAAIRKHASARCEPLGRVKFWAPEREATPLQGQVVFYLGPAHGRFADVFEQFGDIWVPRHS